MQTGFACRTCSCIKVFRDNIAYSSWKRRCKDELVGCLNWILANQTNKTSDESENTVSNVCVKDALFSLKTRALNPSQPRKLKYRELHTENTDALRDLCTSDDKYGAKAVSKRTVFIYRANTGTIPWLTSRMHTHTNTTFWTEHWFYTCIHRAAGTWTPVGRWLNRTNGGPRVESEKPLNYVRENGPKRVVYIASCYVLAVLENMFSISQLCWVHLRYVLVVLNVNIMQSISINSTLKIYTPFIMALFAC